MACCAGAQKDNHASNVLWLTETLVWVGLSQLVHATRHLHQSVCHLGGEEPWCNAVDENASRCELNSQVPCQMQRCRFGGTVAECSILSKGADPDSCDRGRDDNARGVFQRGLLLEEWSKPVSRCKPGILSTVVRATHFWIDTKTLFTLRSMTLANACSGCSSKGAPHVAPALAKRMST